MIRVGRFIAALVARGVAMIYNVPQHCSLSTTMRDASGWNASLYNRTAPFVYSSEYTGAVLSLLAARPGERIIDFGCGSGELTLDIQQTVKGGDGGLVCGLDYSESMVRPFSCG